MAAQRLVFPQGYNLQLTWKLIQLSNRTDLHEYDRNQIVKDINTDYAVRSPGTVQTHENTRQSFQSLPPLSDEKVECMQPFI